MKIPFLDLKAQHISIRREINEAVDSVINDSAFVGGKYVRSFEKKFSQIHDVKYTLGVGNGTDALTIALFAIGVKEGDEVITAANSFIATSEAITNCGARVVFADCDIDSYTIDASKIEEMISARTKAIIPVHLYGQPADMDEILRIAKKYKLSVIEDAAQAVIAEYKGRKVGSFGNMSAFSFYPGKNLGALGDAGAVVTNDNGLFEKARIYADHGQLSKYHHVIEGVNSRLDGIHAAVLEVKLRYIDTWTKQRRRTAELYNNLLGDFQKIILPKEMIYAKHVYHLYVIRTTERDRLFEYMRNKGIEVGIHYPVALPNLPAYAYLKHNAAEFPNATTLSGEILSLPIYPEMTEAQVEYTVNTLKRFFE
jgi:dTDP-4-amino-4,6-dideoxygalactose transaminase